MSRYVDADLLRKEIEKRKNICNGVYERDSDTYYQGKAVAYQETLSLIDSLQQELPSEDLEEAVISIWKCRADGDASQLVRFSYDEVVALIRTGARWQKEQMISALKNDGELPIEFIDKFHEIDRNAFQNGQKNVKEQMLKETVEGTVVELGETYKDLTIYVGAKELNEVLQSLGVKDGDKVKTIIMKEAEK